VLIGCTWKIGAGIFRSELKHTRSLRPHPLATQSPIALGIGNQCCCSVRTRLGTLEICEYFCAASRALQEACRWLGEAWSRRACRLGKPGIRLCRSFCACDCGLDFQRPALVIAVVRGRTRSKRIPVADAFLGLSTPRSGPTSKGLLAALSSN